MKSLVLETHIEKAVYVPLHVSLADLLLTNLVSNAIRHNAVPEVGVAVSGGVGDSNGAGGHSGGAGAGAGRNRGFIRVDLSKEGLVIVNTGREPSIPTEELFERFKKGNTGSDSIGIGLAIVRQICDLSQFDVLYQYRGGLHVLAVSFLPKAEASKLLQNLSLPLPSDAA
jgi:signal transduction histidine kinase